MQEIVCFQFDDIMSQCTVEGNYTVTGKRKEFLHNIGNIFDDLTHGHMAKFDLKKMKTTQ